MTLSRRERMRVAVDIDGVLCDHVTGILPRIFEKYGVVLTKESVRTWDHDFGPSSIVQEFKDAYTDAEFMRHLPPIEGAREGVSRLETSHSVVIVTARPESTRPVTTEWVAQHIGNYVPRFVRGSKLVSEGDVLVDDHPVNITDFLKAGRRAVVFDQPWNRDEPMLGVGSDSKLLSRAHNWAEVVDQIESTRLPRSAQ